MISWIIATHDPMILMANFAASYLDPSDDEVVIVEGAESIAKAYNEGQRRATRPIRCYVHHDVQICDLRRLREELTHHTTPEVGVVGVVGSRTPVLPWWDGDTLGSVFDVRIGHMDYGPGGQCATLDGLLLATVHEVEWDESIPGWHGYDYDICRQMLERGLPNYCLTAGNQLINHNTAGPRDPAHVSGWDYAVTQLRRKWRLDDAGS